jgi:glycerate kinase
LKTLASIDRLGIAPALTHCRIRVACDVTNPLLGPRGAARVFGPQKGATPEEVEQLEDGLGHLAEVWRREGLLESVDRPGDGAAGGLGAGLRAFCRAELCSGARLVAEMIGFDDEIRDADILVTGEGRTDEQTADGKLPVVLAARARAAGAKTVLISGAIADDVGGLGGLFDAMHATVDEEVPGEEAVRRARENLARAAGEAAEHLADEIASF